MSRRPNPRLVKSHRSYTVEETARRLSVHKNTVRAWIRAGLLTIDERRPRLFAGSELRRFLEAKRRTSRQPCAPGQFYCVRCRAPKAPAHAMADYIAISGTSGNLRGLCPDCGTLIHRRVARAKLGEFQAILNIVIAQPTPSISGRSQPPKPPEQMSSIWSNWPLPDAAWSPYYVAPTGLDEEPCQHHGERVRIGSTSRHHKWMICVDQCQCGRILRNAGSDDLTWQQYDWIRRWNRRHS